MHSDGVGKGAGGREPDRPVGARTPSSALDVRRKWAVKSIAAKVRAPALSLCPRPVAHPSPEHQKKTSFDGTETGIFAAIL